MTGQGDLLDQTIRAELVKVIEAKMAENKKPPKKGEPEVRIYMCVYGDVYQSLSFSLTQYLPLTNSHINQL